MTWDCSRYNKHWNLCHGLFEPLKFKGQYTLKMKLYFLRKDKQTLNLTQTG